MRNGILSPSPSNASHDVLQEYSDAARESLPNIAGVQPTQKLAAGKEGDSFGSVVQGQNKPLPCYRTTADDYRKAMR
jgi:hypothetical protein